jgi:hypothetical protein
MLPAELNNDKKTLVNEQFRRDYPLLSRSRCCGIEECIAGYAKSYERRFN